jgi:ADP-heptose:LPS heptosyltransferase
MINRIAIFSTWGIGDVIALAPLVKKLKQVYPQARIVIYSRRGGFLESTTVAHVDGIFKFDTWPKIIGLLKEKADLLIGPGYYRNISGTRNVLFYYLAILLLKAKKKITYHELNARPFVKKNVVEIALDILKKLDIEITPGDYQLYVPFAFDPLSARQSLRDKNISSLAKRVVVHAGSKKGYFTRFWPTERWVQLLEALHKKYSAAIIFIGDSVDVEKTDAITARLGVPSFNLVSQFRPHVDSGGVKQKTSGAMRAVEIQLGPLQ